MIKRNLLLILGLIFAVAASPLLQAAQFARPDATINAAGWTAVNAATHHEALDEVTADDNDYIDSGNGNNTTVILGLSNVSDPGTYANNHILRYRCQVLGTGAPERCNAALYEGATLIFDTGNVSGNRGAFALHEFTIPDASGITDYTNLSIQLTSSNLGGSESAQISWAELEVPDAVASLSTVTSPTFADVTDTTATLGGNVTADGGAAVTSRGVEWGTTSGSYPNSVPEGAGGTGIFTVPVTGLPSSTLIYFRAWATNSAGTGVSSESSFTTNAPASPPTITSPTFTSVTDTTATLGGNVTADGGSAVISRGVEWGTTSGSYPNSVPEGGGGTGIFTVPVTGLPSSTLIYFRAWATNTAGTSVSSESSFTTNAPPAAPPTVTSPTFADVTDTAATLGGNVTADGGSAVTSRGVEWGTTSGSYPNSVPEGGGGTGIFTVPVTGLPTSATLYFHAWAINSTGTGYSAENSFVATSGAIVQASNITFPQVAGNSMRISWTRGTGDGSMVVLRLQATARTDPQDGNDYTANPDYTLAPELPVSSQNFVVYKGSNNSILVTGLSLNTAYSVAIYEYTGTGASTVYVLNPAEASQATTLIPVHNMDNGVNCMDCHNGHGGFMPRDADLKVTCETCHNALGPAAAKLEFDNHLTPSTNPAVEFVDCGMCHELHNLVGANTTQSLHSIDLVTRNNKSFLRANVDKYVSTAVTPAYLHTDQPKRVEPHPDAPQDAITPDRAVEGGDDLTARGYCQVCHTLTSNHTHNPSTSGSDQAHDGGAGNPGPAETHCGECHQHNNRFAPEGGSCVTCHDSQQGPLPRPIITTQYDRLSSHITGGSGVVTQEDCLVCHDQTGHPGDQIVGLKDVDDGVTIFEQATAGAPTTDTGEGELFAPHCLSCHDDGSADSLPASGSDQTATSPFTGSGAPPVIDPVVWSNAAHNRPSGSFPASPVTCVGDGANGCHGSGHGSEQNTLLAPAAGPTISATEFCFVCHDADGPSSKNIFAEFNPAVPQQYIDGSDYDTVNKQHDVQAADQAFSGATLSCKNCHDPHTATAGMPAKNPDTGAALGDYSPANSYSGDAPTFAYSDTPGVDYDPTNPVGSTICPPPGTCTEPDYVQFCLACHDGSAPPGVTLPPSATMLNIADTYANSDQHGNLVGNSSASRGYLKVPWATQADYDAGNQPAEAYAALNCTQCHGPHGSGNIYNLRTSVTVAGQQMNVGGVVVFQNESGPTYTLPLNAQSEQEQFGWGAWCTFCHEQSHDTNDGLGCQSGHMHGGGNF